MGHRQALLQVRGLLALWARAPLSCPRDGKEGTRTVLLPSDLQLLRPQPSLKQPLPVTSRRSVPLSDGFPALDLAMVPGGVSASSTVRMPAPGGEEPGPRPEGPGRGRALPGAAGGAGRNGPLPPGEGRRGVVG